MPRRVRVEGDLFHGRVPDGAVYVGRSAPGLKRSLFHNPFVIGRTIGCEDAQDAVGMYQDWLVYGATAPYPRPGETQRLEALLEQVLERLPELHGRDLACWCQLADPCHADILLTAVQEVCNR